MLCCAQCLGYDYTVRQVRHGISCAQRECAEPVPSPVCSVAKVAEDLGTTLIPLRHA